MNIWRRMMAWPKAHPFAFGVGVATMKTGAADVLVQTKIEKRKEIDMKRLFLFTAFGFSYLGVFQYALYVTAFKRMFPGMNKFANQTFREKLRNRQGQKMLLRQVFFDNFIHPIWFFPIYYTMKEHVQGEGETPKEIVSNAMVKYRKGAWEDWTAFWKIWIAGDLFVMSLPLWARLPTNHAISFVYVCILSFMRGGSPEEIKEIEESADPAVCSPSVRQ